MKRWKRFSSMVLLTFFCFIIPLYAQAGQGNAYSHLKSVMDQFNRSFDVFTDLAAAGNHFAARCATVRNPNSPSDLAGVTFDESWTQNCHAGATCIKNTFSAIDTEYWGGWYFQNGVLGACDIQPLCNWGDNPGAGFDLTGATKITFWARGENGGEKIEFFIGGIGRDINTGDPLQPYPDSLARVPSTGHAITLTKKWKKYTINLKGKDLRYVVGGFGWVADAMKNPSGTIFYLDDIQYSKKRPNDLRFLVSYKTLSIPPGDNFDTILKNVAFTYDNVLVLLAYLARGNKGDLQRASLLADAFVYAQNHDRFYTDGRLRNAYQGGDLILAPGWTPNDREGTVRLPGWWGWDTEQKTWFEDANQVGTDTGNMAWVIIGLLRAYEVLGKAEYLDAAKRLGVWIEANVRDTRGTGGYTGGFEGWEPSCGDPGPTPVTWKSTEHNIDTYVAFMTLFDITGETVWEEQAMHSKQFVKTMWEACDTDHFATGTNDDGVTPNCDFAPEDVNTWGLMALGEVDQYGAGIDWVQNNCQVSEPCFRGKLAAGIDFNDDGDGIWWEGTAHMVITKRIKGEKSEAVFFLKNLRQAQRFAPNSNGKGIVASCGDGVTTGIEDFLLFNRLHVGATAWYALAELEYNPFWGIKTSDPIPHEGE